MCHKRQRNAEKRFKENGNKKNKNSFEGGNGKSE